MDYLTIGSPVILPFEFRNNPSFPVAPKFDVILANEQILFTGTCVMSGSIYGAWEASFTVPSSYETEEGGEVITIEAYGTDFNGKVRSVEKQLLLTDAAEPFTPYGIIVREGYHFEDSIVLDKATYPKVTVELVDATGNILIPASQLSPRRVQRIMSADGVPDRFVPTRFQEWKYSFVIPAKDVVFPTSTYGPHLLNYTLSDCGLVKKFENHPVYRVNHYWLKHLTSLRMYLDKARLTEIDPTLQWRDDELCQSLLDGAAFINNYKPTLTYWVIESYPEAMQNMLWLVAAYHALNARYLAEGFTAFEFQGLSTNLTVDRREAITYKIEEIKAHIEANLEAVKKLAVQNDGTGTDSEGNTSNTTGKALGALGLSKSPAMNRYRPYRRF